jgi:hypothetical protein
MGRLLPVNYIFVPYSPFPGASFSSMSSALNLDKDYLISEQLQTTTIAFEVPLEKGLKGIYSS